LAENQVIEINTRRRFLKIAAASLCLTACPTWGSNLLTTPNRNLSLHNRHTGESVQVDYWEQGRYIPESLSDLNRIMRDHRTDEVAPIDYRLFDLLFVLHGKTNSKQPFHIISGFRSAASNGMLHATTSGVAKGSLHLKGQAVDICLPDCDLSNLRNASLALKGGGVGYYPASNFVHVDVGRVRAW